MKISKYLHSCLIVEEKGKRLLIDPGAFSFAEGKLKPEDLGAVDAILITHQHLDHYYPDALKVLLKIGSPVIYTNAEIAELLKKEGIASQVIAAGEGITVAGFSIHAYAAKHGPIPAPPPDNLAYVINDRLLHPGDSHAVEDLSSIEILALPITAPWLRLVDALAFAQSLKLKTVIPIHDAIMKDFMLERVYQMCDRTLSERGIAFKPLGIGEAFNV